MIDHELFWGLQSTTDRFVSPIGAHFLAGELGTFLHCNPRHHSFAFANAPYRAAGLGPRASGHFMCELDDLDLLGRQWDAVQDAGVTGATDVPRVSDAPRQSPSAVIASSIASVRRADSTWRFSTMRPR
jgi:hypothetical protein